MSPQFFVRRRAERFARLLDEAAAGHRHRARDHVDRVDAEADEELAELVAISRRLSTLKPSLDVEPDPEFRAGLRAMLIATAEREGIGQRDGIGQTARPEPTAVPVAGGRHARTRRTRARGAIISGVIGSAIAVSGISAASENAVPGDALYSVKRSTERAQLALAGSELSRGQLFLEFARIRLNEAKAVLGDSEGFAAVLADMDADTREGVKLITGAAMQQRDEKALESVASFVATQRSGVTTLLKRAQAGDYDRARQSLDLLDAVERRVEGLRQTLSCWSGAAAESDALGPLPQTCPTATPASRAQPPQRLTPSETPTSTTTPTTTPHQSSSPTESATPSTPPPASSAAEATPSPSAQPETGTGLLDGLGRLLGDLLR